MFPNPILAQVVPCCGPEQAALSRGSGCPAAGHQARWAEHRLVSSPCPLGCRPMCSWTGHTTKGRGPICFPPSPPALTYRLTYRPTYRPSLHPDLTVWTLFRDCGPLNSSRWLSTRSPLTLAQLGSWSRSLHFDWVVPLHLVVTISWSPVLRRVRTLLSTGQTLGGARLPTWSTELPPLPWMLEHHVNCLDSLFHLTTRPPGLQTSLARPL